MGPSSLWKRTAVTAALVLVSAGCHKQPVVGLLCPVTGARQEYGKSVQQGAHLALETADVPDGLKLAEADSESSPATAAKKLRGLLADEGARLVVGGVTNAEAEALVPVLNDVERICISPTASEEKVTRQSKYMFRLFQSTALEAQTAALYLEQKGGVHRLVVLSDGTPFATSIDGEFRKHYTLKMGGRIVGAVRIGSDGWARQLADLRSAHDPQGVFVIGYAGATLEALKELQTQGFRGARCVTSALYVGDLVHENQKLLEGVTLAMTPYDPRSDAEPVHGFVKAFREKYHRTPDLWAAYGYDAMRVALKTMKASKSLFTPELLQAMHFGVQEYQGVTGPIAFNDYGEVSRFPIMHCVHDGTVWTCRELLQKEVAKAQKELEDFLRRQRSGGS